MDLSRKQKLQVLTEAAKAAKVALDTKAQHVKRQLRRRTVFKLHELLLREAESAVTQAMIPLIKEQAHSIASGLSNLSKKDLEGLDLDEKHLENLLKVKDFGAPAVPAVFDSNLVRTPPLLNTDSVVLDNFPDVRQTDHYSCGAAASMAVGVYHGVGPSTLEEWKALVGTNAEGTEPEGIIHCFEHLGCSVEYRQRLHLDDLRQWLIRDYPIICPVQDYDETPDVDWDSGHYLVVMGIVPGFVIVQDSSLENVEHKPGGSVAKEQEDISANLEAPGKKLISFDTWLKYWYDIGEGEAKYIRYGIAIGPPVSGFKLGRT